MSHAGDTMTMTNADVSSAAVVPIRRRRILGVEDESAIRQPPRRGELRRGAGATRRGNDRVEAHAHAAARRIHSRDLTLDSERREAIVRGSPVDLTKQEFDLLYLLAARPGIVFSRAALLSKVWSDEVFVTERTVDTVVSRLRKKIEREAQDPELILTAWGVGYKFADVE